MTENIDTNKPTEPTLEWAKYGKMHVCLKGEEIVCIVQPTEGPFEAFGVQYVDNLYVSVEAAKRAAEENEKGMSVKPPTLTQQLSKVVKQVAASLDAQELKEP